MRADPWGAPPLTERSPHVDAPRRHPRRSTPQESALSWKDKWSHQNYERPKRPVRQKLTKEGRDALLDKLRKAIAKTAVLPALGVRVVTERGFFHFDRPVPEEPEGWLGMARAPPVAGSTSLILVAMSGSVSVDHGSGAAAARRDEIAQLAGFGVGEPARAHELHPVEPLAPSGPVLLFPAVHDLGALIEETRDPRVTQHLAKEPPGCRRLLLEIHSLSAAETFFAACASRSTAPDRIWRSSSREDQRSLIAAQDVELAGSRRLGLTEDDEVVGPRQLSHQR